VSYPAPVLVTVGYPTVTAHTAARAMLTALPAPSSDSAAQCVLCAKANYTLPACTDCQPGFFKDGADNCGAGEWQKKRGGLVCSVVMVGSV
jgi:hypothetical protein